MGDSEEERGREWGIVRKKGGEWGRVGDIGKNGVRVGERRTKI